MSGKVEIWEGKQKEKQAENMQKTALSGCLVCSVI